MRGAAVTGAAATSMSTSTRTPTSTTRLTGASIRTRYQPARGVGASGSTIRSTAREYPTGTRGPPKSSTEQHPGMLSHGKPSAAVPRQEGRTLPVAVRTNTVTAQQADGRTRAVAVRSATAQRVAGRTLRPAGMQDRLTAVGLSSEAAAVESIVLEASSGQTEALSEVLIGEARPGTTATEETAACHPPEPAVAGAA